MKFTKIVCVPKIIILGNIYRPPRDINENYRQFIDEFTTVLAKLERSHSDVIIAGDFNIDLRKIHEKPIFGYYFDAITGHSFSQKLRCPLDARTGMAHSLTISYIKYHIAF